jgi:hypothetical protein
MKLTMKKEKVISVARFLEIAFFLLAMIAFLAWINNIVIALQWDPSKIKPVDANTSEGKVEKANPSNIKAEEMNTNRPKGFISSLDRFAVDYSTVSTFIIFFGFALLSFRFYEIAHAKKETNVSENFPSFKHYTTITVTLGLIGTIWGLIMVGNYDIKTLTNPDLMMPELMKCMKTALYSTLVALFWIFIVIYPLSWVMPATYRRVSGYTGMGNGNIISIIAGLGSAASNATAKIKEMLKSMDTTVNSFAAVLELLIKNKEGKQEGILPELKTSISDLNQVGSQQQKTMQDLQTLLGSFSSELNGARERREKAERKANESEQLNQGLHDAAVSLQRLLGKIDEWKKEK